MVGKMTGTLKTEKGTQNDTAKPATTATGVAPLARKLPQPASEGMMDVTRRPAGFGTVEPSRQEMDARLRDTYEQKTGQKRRPAGFGSE